MIFDLIFNRKKFKKPAKLTLSNIKGFLQGNIRSFLQDVEILKPKEHIKEQAIWRLHQVAEKSPECLKQEKCIFCGCSTAEKVFEDRECKEGCYPEMKNELDWFYFKKDNKIKL
jgi:hypothetical protein